MSSAPPSHRCLRCKRGFGSEGKLQHHYSLKEECQARYELYLKEKGDAAYHDLNSKPATSSARNQAPHTHPAAPVSHDPFRPMLLYDRRAENLDVPDLNGSLGEQDVEMADAVMEDKNVPTSNGSQLSGSVSNPRHTYGYATVRTHPNAARIFRYENPEPVLLMDNPLNQPRLFETGEWLCELPISNASRTRYFEIEQHKGCVPWENLTDLYKSVDALPHGPDWRHKNMVITTSEGTEVLDIYKRCPVDCTRHLIGLSRLRYSIRYAPEIHYRTAPDGRQVRVRSDMCSGEWWWRTQDLLGGDATIAPIILATDATILSLFSDKKVWPVYLTIGNIDKEIRKRPSEQAMILVGYIPVPDLSFISNEDERREKKWEVYHACMGEILASLKKASNDGVEMVCADGAVRRVHPVVAAHMADFEEQCTVACTYRTRCPICDVPHEGRGDGQGEAKIRTRLQTAEALRHASRGYTWTRHHLGIRPTMPYWAKLPFATGHSSLVPDMLHQIHNGVFKDHLLGRWKCMLGDRTMDERLMGIPRFPGIRHFKTGISSFFKAKWRGTESKAAGKIFLPLVAESHPTDAVRAARCLVDFMYRVHLPQLDDDDLAQLEADLEEFHRVKHVFVSEGAIDSEDGYDGIPKIHMLSHYVHLIREYGAPDGFNTELSERLHIDYVKSFFRLSNKVDPIEQMVTMLQRREAWVMQRKRLETTGEIKKRQRSPELDGETNDVNGLYIPDDNEHNNMDFDENGDDVGEGVPEDRRLDNNNRHDELASLPSSRKQRHDHLEYHPEPIVRHAKHPTRSNVPARDIILNHKAPEFIDGVKSFVSGLPGGEEHARLLDENFRFGIWTRVSLEHDPLPFAPLVGSRTESIRARPAHLSRRLARHRPSTFDTVLLEANPEAQGIQQDLIDHAWFETRSVPPDLNERTYAFGRYAAQPDVPAHSGSPQDVFADLQSCLQFKTHALTAWAKFDQKFTPYPHQAITHASKLAKQDPRIQLRPIIAGVLLHRFCWNRCEVLWPTVNSLLQPVLLCGRKFTAILQAIERLEKEAPKGPSCKKLCDSRPTVIKAIYECRAVVEAFTSLEKLSASWAKRLGCSWLTDLSSMSVNGLMRLAHEIGAWRTEAEGTLGDLGRVCRANYLMHEFGGPLPPTLKFTVGCPDPAIYDGHANTILITYPEGPWDDVFDVGVSHPQLGDDQVVAESSDRAPPPLDVPEESRTGESARATTPALEIAGSGNKASSMTIEEHESCAPAQLTAGDTLHGDAPRPAAVDGDPGERQTDMAAELASGPDPNPVDIHSVADNPRIATSPSFTRPSNPEEQVGVSLPRADAGSPADQSPDLAQKPSSRQAKSVGAPENQGPVDSTNSRRRSSRLQNPGSAELGTPSDETPCRTRKSTQDKTAAASKLPPRKPNRVSTGRKKGVDEESVESDDLEVLRMQSKKQSRGAGGSGSAA
ncbi:leucine-tRNA ligase [Ceratobasidium sp. AG-Ba]|nr:leucine-tRNA ligase [Ceratobasidium sp. AG-Ba]